MAVLMANSRRELDSQQFPWPIMLAAPLLAVFLQAYLPLRFPRLDVFDLPLLVVIYFSVSRRSPIAGTLIGAIVGLLQDGVTHQPIGIHGIANTIIGFSRRVHRVEDRRRQPDHAHADDFCFHAGGQLPLPGHRSSFDCRAISVELGAPDCACRGECRAGPCAVRCARSHAAAGLMRRL